MKKILEWIKTVAWAVFWAVILVIFVYVAYTYPEMLAGALRGIWEFVAGFFGSVIRFAEAFVP